MHSVRIRTQLTLGVSVVVALIVTLAGLVVVLRDDRRRADDLDRLLAARVAAVRAAAETSGALPTDGSYAVRLIDGGTVRGQAGPAGPFPLPARNGYSTVRAGDTDWRSLTEPLVTGAQLQVLISLAGLAERHTDNVLVVDFLMVLAALLSAAGVWFATGLVLRPYQRLVQAARQLDPADPGRRLPAVTKPPEVAELTEVINGLLDRPRTAAPPPGPTPGGPLVEPPAARPPAVELPVAELRPPLSDLGANLDRLLDNPEMPATQRHLLLAAIAEDHRRVVTLLEAMRAATVKDPP